MAPAVIRTGKFALWSFSRLTRPGAEIRVYIEGDGLAFLDAYRPSPDPTPVDPLALRLAARDPSPNVLYLARPCQYPTRTGQKGCGLEYWTSHRYAPEIVAALDRAITDVLAKSGSGPITLIGFSGGGTAAALTAARRSDVARVVTVAANLDHAAWTKLDDSTPLGGSLNPPEFAERLGRIPQIHLAGDEDDIVPLSVIESYRRALPASADIRIVRFPRYDHTCCWVEAWPEILARWLDRP